jgi:site-specific DNA recombinase
MQQATDVSKVAVIYCRVSTTRQEEEGTSLESQERECREFCGREGLRVAAVFKDTSSGANMDRAGLESTLEIITQGDAGVLVTYAYDRLARNLTHQAVITYQVEDKHGGKLLSVTEERDDSPMAALMRTFRGVMAEEERKKILERTDRGKRQRARNGAMSATVSAYGYHWTDDRRSYVIDPDTAQIVRRVFAEVTAGHSMSRIARTLTLEGVPTPSARHANVQEGGNRRVAPAWNGETVRKLLINPLYKGEPVAFSRQVVKERVRDPETGEMRRVRKARPGANPIALPASPALAIVTPPEWMAANEQLKRNKEESARSSTHAKNHLLRAGFVFCGSCGRKLIAKATRSYGKMQYKYECMGNNVAKRHTCESGATISAPMLDTDIWGKVLVVINTDAVARALLERSGGGVGDPATLTGLQDRLTGYDGTLEKLGKRRRMLRRQQANAYDDSEYDELEAEIKQVSERLRTLTQERDEVAETVERLTANAATVAPLIQRIRHVDEDAPFDVEPGDVTFLPGGKAGFQLELPQDAPEPGEPGYEEAILMATYAFMAPRKEQLRGKAVTHLADDLTMMEKRSILRWLGVRVDVYREARRQYRWELRFNTPTGSGPFPLGDSETPVVTTSFMSTKMAGC